MAELKECQFIIPVPGQSYTDVRPTISGSDWNDVSSLASRIAFSVGNRNMGNTLSSDAEVNTKVKQKLRFGSTNILFDSEQHSYSDEAGTKYLSGSTFAGMFEADFPREAIAKKSAEKRGTTPEKILEGWDSKGETSLLFGSTVHKAIETKIKYDEDPNDPYLKMLTDDIMEQLGPDQKASEVFVCNTEEKLCGFVDCLVKTGDKKVRLIDFKTGDIDKKISLTPTAKELFPDFKQKTVYIYYLQLNFYRHILETMGYEVESMEIWVKGIEHWSEVDVPVVDIEPALEKVWK